jgi:alpha-1,2-mannosyltransferase
MNAASVAGLAATLLVVSSRLHGWNRRAVVTGLSGVLVAMVLEPVRSTIGFGQVNLILMGLVALDCLLPRTRWPRDLLVGLAAAIKLTPAVFVVFFLVHVQPVLPGRAGTGDGRGRRPSSGSRWWLRAAH